MVGSRIIINDWLIWGNLLKTWVTETSYFADGTVYARPRTLDDLKEQLRRTGAGSVPDWVVDFELHEWQQDKLVIELPSKDMTLAIEWQLKADVPYPLPPFYMEAFGDLLVFADREKGLAFHAMRIGESLIRTCG
jgi:hypothetical protein